MIVIDLSAGQIMCLLPGDHSIACPPDFCVWQIMMCLLPSDHSFASSYGLTHDLSAGQIMMCMVQ